MNGKKETALEKILKPIRINPVAFGISAAGFGLGYLLNDLDNIIGKVASYISVFGGGCFLGFYSWSARHYLNDKKVTSSPH